MDERYRHTRGAADYLLKNHLTRGERGIKTLAAANEVGHILVVPLLLLLLASTISSCAKISDTTHTQEIKRAENSDTSTTPEIKRAEKAPTIKTKEWVGHHRDELMTRRGPPSHEARLAHGGKSLVYQQPRGSPNQKHSHCRTVFITNAQGIIQAAADYAC